MTHAQQLKPVSLGLIGLTEEVRRGGTRARKRDKAEGYPTQIEPHRPC